jgi:hypothetical protein
MQYSRCSSVGDAGGKVGWLAIDSRVRDAGVAMTFFTSNWLMRTFRCLSDDSDRGTCARGLRLAPRRLEALECRKLASGTSGVWAFASAPQLRPMKVKVLT